MSGISPKSTRYWFYRSLSCSEALFTVVNRGAGLEMTVEEEASHGLAGGLLRRGHACGMLWGTALASAARARAKFENESVASAATLHASGLAMEEFASRFNVRNCHELIGEDLTKVSGQMRYVFSKKPFECAAKAVEWAPVANQVIEEAFAKFDTASPNGGYRNCSVEAMRKMTSLPGLTEDDPLLVSGFAGGIGLKGNACGAVAAGVFALGLSYYRTHPAPRAKMNKAALQEMGLGDDFLRPSARFLKRFEAKRDALLCPVLSGQVFSSEAEHSEYVGSGGCADLIGEIAELAAGAALTSNS